VGRTGVGHDEAVIDVGGGSGRLAGALLDEGYRDVTILDVSSAALSLGKARLGAQARRVHWLDEDVTRFTPARRYRLWHDRAVFHFLVDAQDRRRYVRALRRALAGGGHAIIATFGVDGPERCSGLPVVRYDAKAMVAALGRGFTRRETLDETHLTPAGREQRFTWFRFEVAAAEAG
jgi:SAM-dependent methyltransferase